jgi:hypothetical protein
VAEMNRTVEKNLIAIITGLTAPSGCAGSCSTSCACAGTVSAPDKAGIDVG